MFLLVLVGCDSDHNVKRIGIVLPIEHQALREIVHGFETTLAATYKQPLKFKVANAQGDINTERAIIEQMRDENYDLIVPIATSTAQMTAAIVNKQPIVALAADYPEQDRKARQPCNIAVVDDEIGKAQIIAFIHQIYPSLKTLTLVYSTSDKIFPEVEQVKKAAAQSGITLHSFMVQNLSDLYSAGQAIPENTQAIFILKDSLIASGINTLIQVANARHIPLITSDDGTVRSGAGFALGVHEEQIGAEGGKLAAQILAGTSPGQLPIVKMTKPTVFINSDALLQEKQDQLQIKRVAQHLNYPIEFLR